MSWNLDKRVETSAGAVATGQCGKGEPLVLAHGWPWSSFSWNRLIPELAKTFHVYWYDMPGYGQSAKSSEHPTGLDIQGKIFCEMLQHWKILNPTVIAHDFGGATTLRAHLLHDSDYQHLVLMNVVAMRPWGSEFFDHVGRHIEAFTGLPPHIHQAIVEAYINGALVNQLDSADFRRLVDPWITDDGQQSFYRQFAQADEQFTAEIESMYPDIRCPVSILWGEQDPWIPIERGEALRDLVKPRVFKPIPNAGHLPQLEAADHVLMELKTLLYPGASVQ